MRVLKTDIKTKRQWSMPNKDTFSIKPINCFINETIEQLKEGSVIVDPFVRNSPFKSLCYSNDLDCEIEADKNINALDFLREIETQTVDMILFDPPYSPRQVSECYKKMDMAVNMQTTQSSFWGNLKKEISRLVKPNGIVISCGWNSGGMGWSNGFNIDEVLLVPHGGWHNDTIVTKEIKVCHYLN